MKSWAIQPVKRVDGQACIAPIAESHAFCTPGVIAVGVTKERARKCKRAGLTKQSG